MQYSALAVVLTMAGRSANVLTKIGLAALIVVVGMGLGVGLGRFIARDTTPAEDDLAPASTSSEVVAECNSPEQLDIAASDAVVEIVQELADRYTQQLLADGQDCMPIAVQPVASSAVVGRLTNGWRTDTHGAQPDVWIPQSSLWLQLFEAQSEDTSMLPDEPRVLARSPTVLAMPKPMAEELGWPDQRLSWDEFFALADDDEGWGARGRSEWGPFRLELSDPRYNTTGWQALLALDQAGDRDSSLERGSLLSLFRVQRVLANIDARPSIGLARYADAVEPLRVLSAMPLEEREVWRFNRTGQVTVASDDATEPVTASSEAAEPADPAGRPELVAMYPSGGDVALESDYPYAPLRASWVSTEVAQFADEFGDYLTSDEGVALFADAGFRDQDNQPGEALTQADSMRAMDQIAAESSGELPKVGAFRKLRSQWVTVPRVSRTLFVVDVSGSMQVLVPNSSKTRLQATVDAAQRSLDIIPNASEVGLWEFSTDLPGGLHDGDYRVLVEPGPLNALVDGVERKRKIDSELEGLGPENDTALNDTVLAAYRSLRRSYETGAQHSIVLLTDGRNDDDRSISHNKLLRRLTRLNIPGEPIDVVAIAYGEGPDLDKLTEITETVGGRVIASPQLRNLNRLFVEALRR